MTDNELKAIKGGLKNYPTHAGAIDTARKLLGEVYRLRARLYTIRDRVTKLIELIGDDDDR